MLEGVHQHFCNRLNPSQNNIKLQHIYSAYSKTWSMHRDLQINVVISLFITNNKTTVSTSKTPQSEKLWRDLEISL